MSDGGSQVCDPVVAARANLAVASENLLRDAARLLDGESGRGEARGEGRNMVLVLLSAPMLLHWSCGTSVWDALSKRLV